MFKKIIDLLNINDSQSFSLDIECNKCGSQDIEFYIDDVNKCITIYCPDCENEETFY